MKNNKKSGISLIVLVITIIVIVILAVAVILSIANNNPIENANKATFQNDLKVLQESIELAKASKYAETNGASYSLSESDLSSISNYKDRLYISNGEVWLNSDKFTKEELVWANNNGITNQSTKGFEYDENGNLKYYVGEDLKSDSSQNVTVNLPSVKQVGQKDEQGVSRYNVFEDEQAKDVDVLVFSAGTEYISFCAFSNCSNLTKVVFPRNKIIWNMYAFSGSNKLKNIEVYKETFFTDKEDLDKFVDEKREYSACYFITKGVADAIIEEIEDKRVCIHKITEDYYLYVYSSSVKEIFPGINESDNLADHIKIVN